MSSVAVVSRLDSAEFRDSSSDLNQVVGALEHSVARALIPREVRFALSTSCARVGLSASELETLFLGLCAQAGRLLDNDGHLLVETRGASDAPLGSTGAAGATAPRAEGGQRLIVRVGRLGHVMDPEVLRERCELGFSELAALLDRMTGQLEFVPFPNGDLAFVAHLPNAVSVSSGRMPVARPHEACLILLVEDEPQVQAVTGRILRAHGYTVITAHDERTALAQAEQHGAAVDLVLSDLVLPGVSGTELARRLRKPCQNAQVLYISGYSSDAVGALSHGTRFLRKPFTAQELLYAVRELLPNSGDEPTRASRNT